MLENREKDKSTVEKLFKHIWEYIWDWKKSAKGHLEKGYHFSKENPFTVLSMIVVVVILTYYVLAYFNGKKIESLTSAYQSTNSFLAGQLSTTTTQLNNLKADYNQKISEYATTIANLKTDYNERLRGKDTEILKLTSERDNALQRAAIVESMPGNLINIYTNIAANAPTNFNQLTSFLNDVTNIFSRNYILPKFNVWLNEILLSDEHTPYLIFSTNRSIFIKIQNDSDVTADKLSVIFAGRLSETNFIASHDWNTDKLTTNPNYISRNVESQTIVGGHDMFTCTTFQISTNYSSPFLDAQLSVYSSTSKIQRYSLRYVFTGLSKNDFQTLTNYFPQFHIQLGD